MRPLVLAMGAGFSLSEEEELLAIKRAGFDGVFTGWEGKGSLDGITALIRREFPDIGAAPYVIMGGTDCRHFHALTENALRFAPVRVTNAQNASCHAVDENVTVAALAEGVRFVKTLLREYDL